MLEFTQPFLRRLSTKFIFVHHAAAKIASAEDIHRWHLESGFFGIGYASVVRGQGAIEEGRPHWAESAQAYGYNEVSLGVCLEGDFTQQKLSMVQRNALINELVKYKKLYPEAVIVAHYSLLNTECPGLTKADFWEIVSAVQFIITNENKNKLQRLYDRFKKILRMRTS